MDRILWINKYNKIVITLLIKIYLIKEFFKIKIVFHKNYKVILVLIAKLKILLLLIKW